MSPTPVSRRAVAVGSAWSVPIVSVAAAAQSFAASPAGCLQLFRESSGGNNCKLGLVTNSNSPGGASFNATIHTKPLYDCLCGPLTYCTNDDPASVSNVVVKFYVPMCYTIAPLGSWTTDNGGAPFTKAVSTATLAGTQYQLITITYASISKYGAGQEVQIPINPGSNCCGGDKWKGPTIFGETTGQCTAGGSVASTGVYTLTTSGFTFC